MSRARAATLALAMVVGASAAGVMKTCRDMNASAAPLVPPPLPAAASSLQFHEVERLRKRSSTVIWTHCGSNYTICQSTVPRWRQYTRSFGYDLLVLRERNPSITGIATHAWDRVFVAQQLLGRGYEWAMHVDGDTAVLDSRLGIVEFARRTGCSSSAFLYLSQDVGKHGSLRAPCGPNNFGVFILRNGAGARAMLEHVRSQSQRPGRFWQAWPAEQGVVNTWLESQAPTSYCQAPYGRLQRHISKYDHPIHLQRDPPPIHLQRVAAAGAAAKGGRPAAARPAAAAASKGGGSNAAGWAPLIERTLRAYQEAGVWILHTPAMQKHQAFAKAIYQHVERLFPVAQARPFGDAAGAPQSSTPHLKLRDKRREGSAMGSALGRVGNARSRPSPRV